MVAGKNVTFPPVISGHLLVDPDLTDVTEFGVYSTGTVQKHEIGLRHRIGDRVYRYGKAGGVLTPSKAAFNDNVFFSSGGLIGAGTIGDMEVTLTLDATTSAATAFGTKDQMIGGYFLQPDTTNCQFRIIKGHDFGATSAVIKILLDGPLTRTFVATSICEFGRNPYNNLKVNVGQVGSAMGIPATAIASGSYGWVQTWGPCWITPQASMGDRINERTAYFRGDGTINDFDGCTNETTGHQVAGFIIGKNVEASTWYNPPFIWLQISP
ncbi:MAG: hypothetical protein KAS32_04495 [Candidatus Peribacteraceae bacterium]|nr:hypothetical protein [Candidatus Peribacteraceae bacterium]